MSDKDAVDIEHLEEKRNESELADSLTEEEIEPEVHWRTWFVVAAAIINYWAAVMFVLSCGYWSSEVIATVGGASSALWFANAWTIPATVLNVPFARIGDRVGRKGLWIASCAFSFIGCVLVASANSIGPCIAGTTLFGIGFSNCGNLFAVPAEILPRRHRGTASMGVQSGGFTGLLSGLLMGAGLIDSNPGGYPGWRSLFWLIAGAQVLTLASILVAYHPPPRPNPENHTLTQKLFDFDVAGTVLLTIALTPFLVAITWGGSTHPWNSVPVIAPMVVGLVFAIVFGLHQYYIEKDGLFSRALFTNRNAGLCMFGIVVEGFVYQTFNDYYGAQTSALYETRPLYNALRFAVFPFGALFATPFYIYGSYKYRLLKEQLVLGFILFTIGIICLATTGVNSGKVMIFYIALCGVGFASPISCLVSVAQLAVAPLYVGQMSGLMIALRSLGAALGPAICGAIFTSKLTPALSSYIGKAATSNGIPAASVATFVEVYVAGNSTAIGLFPGSTSTLVTASAHAMKEAYAHAYHYLWASVAPWAAVAVGCVIVLQNPSKLMNHIVDASVEPRNREVPIEQTS